MSWNPVLNLFLEIKQKMIKTNKNLWEYKNGERSCLEYWINVLNDSYYREIFQNLLINEFENYVLIRYGKFSKVFGNRENNDLKYNTFWDLYDGLYRECRSVVLDMSRDCLVLTPFKKFLNLNEIPETSMENIQKMIKNASCVEFSDKLDGSMQSARYYNGEIIMAGSQAINPEASWRLKDGYARLTDGHKKMIMDYPEYTFIFEYISQKDAHVVHYDREGLFLIGIRDVRDGREFGYHDVIKMANDYNVETTRVFDKTLEDVVSELDLKKANEAEGFVLNIDGYKVKIKYNDYVGIHKTINRFSSGNTIIEYIANDSLDDLIAKVPEAYKDQVRKTAYIIYDYLEMMKEKTEMYYLSAPKNNKKEFMVWVTDNVPEFLQGYVRNKFLGKSYDFLRKDRNSYLKMKELERRMDCLSEHS